MWRMRGHNNAHVVRFSILVCLLLTGFVGAAKSPDATPGTAGAGTGAPGDTRVVVNIPAFRMDVFQQGQLIKSYRIGIGYPQFPLPTGLRSAREIIISPTWTPPNEPWVNSPKSKARPGEKIPAGSDLNPLGPIKIPIGLPNLIHGGKHPAQIGGFASHGCVGLTDPQIENFAKLLAHISGSDVSDQEIAQDEQDKTETQPIKLSNAIPVELRYQTVQAEDGKLDIYRDVYGLGTDTADNVLALLQSYGVSADQLTPVESLEILGGLSQMERNASGKAVIKMTAEPSTLKKGTTPYVTRTIVGPKAFVIDVQALKGKGYPEPVNLDTGQPSKKPRASNKKTAVKSVRHRH